MGDTPTIDRVKCGPSPVTRSTCLSVFIVLALSGCEGCKDGASTTSTTKDGATSTAPTTIADAAPVNAVPIPTASVAAMVNPENLPAYAGPTGSVEGTVVVVGDPAIPKPQDFRRCPDAEKTWGKDFREGTPSTPNGPRPLADAIIGATGYKGFYVPAKDEATELTIEGCAFTQRTVTMTFGQRLEVKNLSNDFWTPLIEPAPNLVLMMAAPKGDPVKIYPKKPGRYVLGDRDRKYVYGDLYVFLYPTHTVSKLDGTFRIDGLPVGKLKVSARHPRIDDEVSVEVDVKPNVVSHVDLKLEHKIRDAGAPKDAGPDADLDYPRLR
jgi:hypothetical protein